MEIRSVRPEELSEMIDLQCRVFRADGQLRYGQYIHGDSSYEYGQTRVVVVEGGRIAATLRIWDREMRIGATAVRMGGIGGVCTDPELRGRGYASALMGDAISWMRREGYLTSVLFSAISTRFYRNLGWGSVPMAGFRIRRVGRRAEPGNAEWGVSVFDETCVLAQVMALYEAHNLQRSGTLVRQRAYWDSAPARLRGILPSVVARRGGDLGGYLHLDLGDDTAEVLEVGYDREEEGALVALVDHLLRVCEAKGLDEIAAVIPPQHPLAAAIEERGDGGDLNLTGDSAMMMYPVDLKALFGALLPELQSRIDRAGGGGTPENGASPAELCLRVGDQACALSVDDEGRLTLGDAVAETAEISLSAGMFWRVLMGESGWGELEPTLRAMGTGVSAEQSSLLTTLFRRREVIFWAPDHY